MKDWKGSKVESIVNNLQTLPPQKGEKLIPKTQYHTRETMSQLVRRVGFWTVFSELWGLVIGWFTLFLTLVLLSSTIHYSLH